MADRLPPTADANAPSLSGVLTVLMSGAVVAALYFGREVLVPFALAVLLSFLLAPGVRWLRRIGVGRGAAVTATVLVAFVAIFGFAAILTQEVGSLGPKLPEYRHNIEAKIRSLPGAGGGMLDRASAMFHELRTELMRSQSLPSASASRSQASSPAAIEPAKPLPVEVQQPEPAPLEIVQSVVGPLLQPLATAGLVVVLVVLIMLKREDLRDRLLRLAGVGDLHRTTEAMDDAAQRVSRYLLMQLAVNAAGGLLIAIGLALIGIPNPALWGILVVLLRFIPFLGIVIAACFPLALAIAVDPGWSLVAWTALLFVGVELVIGNLVEPYLYGGSTGLSPVAVIVAAVFWTWLWGPIGLLLSTPLTACLVVLGRHVPQLHFLDVLLGNQPALTPEETLYQRMLANDPEEATEQAEEFAKDRSLAEFFDEVAIPVLMRAQADSDRGALSAERRARVKESFTGMLDHLCEEPLPEADPQSEQGGMRPKSAAIVCIAGRNELDETAAQLLAHLLRLRGHHAQVFSADALMPESGQLFVLKDAAVVCLSLISTGAPARARHFVRRVRRRAPRATLLLGLWALPAGETSTADATAITTADAVSTSLGDAIADIEASLSAAGSPAPALRPAAAG